MAEVSGRPGRRELRRADPPAREPSDVRELAKKNAPREGGAKSKEETTTQRLPEFPILLVA
jgi:hypothetical protein